ncbi:MAG: cell division protein ZapE [Pontixanthobacter sp.]
MNDTPVSRYEELVRAGELRADDEQASAARQLAALRGALTAQRAPGFFDRLFGKSTPAPRGIYMWGGVGRGKSMLMDLFHDALTIQAKKRVHFHAFMQDVHGLMRSYRASDPGDPIPHVAHDIAAKIRCLCFDEMVVNNSADAMIMSRLFRALMVDEGVTVVTTSNRPPRDLYKDGLNREHFLPFIDLIESHLDIVPLNGPIDYRLDRIGGLDTWHTPLGDAATAQVREAFFRLTDYDPDDGAHVPSADIDLGGGRSLHVPRSLKGVGVLSFKRLCATPRGAADYLALARAYHTIIIVGIPVMGPDDRNEATRFTTLIDALYEQRVKLFATADAQPSDLYPSGDGSFEFARSVSRLMEMQSEDYMALGHGSDETVSTV